MNRWVEYIQELYDDMWGDADIEYGEAICTPKSELFEAMKHLKNGKASVNDKITIEIIKALSKEA